MTQLAILNALIGKGVLAPKDVIAEAKNLLDDMSPDDISKFGYQLKLLVEALEDSEIQPKKRGPALYLIPKRKDGEQDPESKT